MVVSRLAAITDNCVNNTGSASHKQQPGTNEHLNRHSNEVIPVAEDFFPNVKPSHEDDKSGYARDDDAYYGSQYSAPSTPVIIGLLHHFKSAGVFTLWKNSAWPFSIWVVTADPACTQASITCWSLRFFSLSA